MLLYTMKQFRRITWKTLFCHQAPEIQSDSPSSSLFQQSEWHIGIGLHLYSSRLLWYAGVGCFVVLFLQQHRMWMLATSQCPVLRNYANLIIPSMWLCPQMLFKSQSWEGKFSLDTSKLLEKWGIFTNTIPSLFTNVFLPRALSLAYIVINNILSHISADIYFIHITFC